MARRRDEQELPKFDPNPILAFDIVEGRDGNKHLVHWMAVDPKYGPQSERQIEWHQRHGTPGSETWIVGVPCDGPGFKTKRADREAVAA